MTITGAIPRSNCRGLSSPLSDRGPNQPRQVPHRAGKTETQNAKKIDHISRFELASFGWHLIPCHSVRADGSCTCDKPRSDNPISIGKHRRSSDWKLKTTTEYSIIRELLDTSVPINSAVACRRYAEAVIDVNPWNGGTESLESPKSAKGLAWTPTPTVTTGELEDRGESERGEPL